MSPLQVQLRSQLVDLQKLYDEKQAKLSKIKSSSPKKSNGSAKSTPAKASRAAAVDSGDSCLRGPGRPKKRTLKSTRRRMGRPPKKIVKEEVEDQVSTVKEEKCPTPMDGLAAALKSSQGIYLPDSFSFSLSQRTCDLVKSFSHCIGSLISMV